MELSPFLTFPVTEEGGTVAVSRVILQSNDILAAFLQTLQECDHEIPDILSIR